MNRIEFIKLLQDFTGHVITDMSGFYVKLSSISNSDITRANAAEILHVFMRDELTIPDMVDTEDALYTKDLYDCNKCVGHIIQVIGRKLMNTANDLFGGRSLLTTEDAVYAAKKLRELSNQIYKSANNESADMAVSYADYCKLKDSRDDIVTVDVRNARAYEAAHLENAVNYPLSEIAKLEGISGDECFENEIINFENEIMKEFDKAKPICFYCTCGSEAEIAANIFMRIGFEKVCFLRADINDILD